MIIKILKTENDEMYCFEFPNAFVGKSGVRTILDGIQSVEVSFFDNAWLVDIFCEFSYEGETFFVSEPHGDNSYYMVCCNNPDTEQLEMICKHFKNAVPPKLRKYRIIGMLVVITVLTLMAAELLS